jgi:hypothetical protein
MITLRWRLLAGVGLWFVVIACGGLASAQDGGRVFALLVIDTDAQIAGLERDGEAMVSVLRQGLGGPPLLKLDVLNGEDVQPEAILNYYKNLPSGPNDALLFYYSGHGATIEGRGHVLTTSDGNLMRATLRAAMETRRARLCALLTDCCSTLIKPRRVPPAPGAPAPQPPRVSPLLRCLFLQHGGTVDVTSSSFGESSWSDFDRGGFFTAALSAALRTGELAPFDSDNDGFVTWTELFDTVRSQTQSIYQNFRQNELRNDQERLEPGVVVALRRQLDQVPQAFALGEPLRQTRIERAEYFAPNLGIHFRLVPAGESLGAELTRPPLPGSGAAQLQLEPGDTITVLDTLPIRAAVDVMNHHGRTSVVFINVRTRRPQTGMMTLPPYTPLPDSVPREQYAANLGMHYQLVPQGEAFGARLSRNASAGTPVGAIRLERGDMVVRLDGLPIRGPADVLAHYGRTTVEFVDIRTGTLRTEIVQLPGAAGR